MNTNVKAQLMLILLLLGMPLASLAQTTAFTYQGQLHGSGNPANGRYDFIFDVFDAPSGGSALAVSVSTNSVPVTNGLFVIVLDFGSTPFTGQARWLQVRVSTNGTGNYFTLAPRQQLTPAPYAIFASTAGGVSSGTISNAQIAAGQVVKSLNGLRDNVTLAGGSNISLVTNGNTLTLNSSGGGVFFLIGTNAYYTNGNVSIGRLPTTNRLEVAGDVSLNGFLKLGGSRTVITGFDGTSNHWFGPNPNADLAFGLNRKGTNNYDLTLNGNFVYGSLSKLDVADNFVAAVRAGDFLFGHSSRHGPPGRALVDLGNELHLNYDADWPTTILGGNVTVRSNLSYQMLTKLDVASNFVATVRAGDFLFGHPTRRGAPGRALVDSVDRLEVNFNADWPKTTLGGKVGIGTGDPQTALHVNGTVTATQFSGSGAGLTGIPGSSIDTTTFNTTFWRTAGNAGTAAGTHFVGTTDNQPLELKANGVRALRLEPNSSGAPNVIGGAPVNLVAAGVLGAVIGGGGASNYYGSGIAYSNSVLAYADFAVVGGGIANRIGPGAIVSAIAGGFANDIDTNSGYSAIGGGGSNKIAAYSGDATIAGGFGNDIGTNSSFTAIGGGYDNNIAANSPYATIPGGRQNSATNLAFAAGNRAKANHTGSFVWADSTDADFASTRTNQFAVRASGGVSLQTTSLKIVGAGLNTTTPVFIHKVTIENLVGANTTYINNPVCNGQPGAILIITQNFSASDLFVTDSETGVLYDRDFGQWTIFALNSQLPVGVAFNVLAIVP